MADLSALFTPFQLGEITIPNRFVMAPMTRSRSPGGLAGEDVAQYYARRAAGGVGLIVTEGVWIDEPSASYIDNVPTLSGPERLSAFGRVADAVHAVGGLIFPQLWHSGLHRHSDKLSPDAPPVLSPSGVAADGSSVGAPMSEADIARVVDAYGRGAQDAQRLGFDGIEIHGAHGYLSDQFFLAATNHRQDRYGGDIAGRTRFAAEVVAECRRRVRPGFPIGFRMSQWKLWDYDARIAASPQELEALVTPLAEAGVDIFHCSTRRYWKPEFEGSDLNLAGWVKKFSGRPTITVGSVGLADALDPGGERKAIDNAPLDELAQRFGRGEFDLVAVGRALLITPDWVNKVREGRLSEIEAFYPKKLVNFY